MEIPLRDIKEAPARLKTDLTDLISSFERRGQLSPIKLRPHPSLKGKYEIVYGNRRFAAVKSLGWESIQAEVVQVGDDEALAIAFSENEDRKNFSDYEKGLLLQRMHEKGKSYSEIAKLIGRSKTFVAQHISMTSLFSDLDVDPEVKGRMLLSLTEKHARILSKISDPLEKWNMAKMVVVANLCVRELEKYLPRIGYSKKRNFRSKKDEVNQVILNLVASLNHKDFRPYSLSRSRRYYNLFDDFPPFDRMDHETADEHNCRVISRISELALNVQDLETKIIGETALSTMYVCYTMQIGGETRTTKSRVTMVLSREEEHQWKIIHEHWSLTEPIMLNDRPDHTISAPV